jgi:hypothetical protein
MSITYYCPICRSTSLSTERRPNGNTTCKNGHKFQSSMRGVAQVPPGQPVHTTGPLTAAQAAGPQPVFTYTGPFENPRPKRPDVRENVYDVLDAERVYQDSRWNPGTTSSGGQHSVAEFVLFMEDCMLEVRRDLARNASPQAENLALDKLRKVVTMGVACFEQHGVPAR